MEAFDGHLIFYIDFEQLKSPFRIEKIFGLVNMKTNVVFKFKLVVTEDGPENMKLEFGRRYAYPSSETLSHKCCLVNSNFYPLLNWGGKIQFFRHSYFSVFVE